MNVCFVDSIRRDFPPVLFWLITMKVCLYGFEPIDVCYRAGGGGGTFGGKPGIWLPRAYMHCS